MFLFYVLHILPLHGASVAVASPALEAPLLLTSQLEMNRVKIMECSLHIRQR